ncbi:hypothetical protein TNCV_1461531 [Trichonephila clavipes]|nr:hypothetical protein TNCV_1461531 [Trichonephila clavipes]
MYKNIRALATWKSPQSPPKQKFLQKIVLEGKVKLVVFFGIQGIVHLRFIPDERTANKELYVDILCRLRVPIQKKIPKLRAKQS